MSKILVIMPSWLGDVIMAKALLQLLQEREPKVIIHALAPTYLHPLLTRMSEISKVLNNPWKHGELKLKERLTFARSLEREQYQQAIVLPNSLKSALIPWIAKIPKRTGWRGEMRYFLLNDLRYLDKNSLPLMVERYLALGLPKNSSLPAKLALPKLTTNQTNITATLEKLKISVTSKIAAFCIGAEYGPAKRWPEEHFAKLAKKLTEQGFMVWLLGSQKDATSAEKIQQLSNNICLNLTGKTELAEVVDLLSLANCVVSNDSGLMHVAAALEKPLIAIYGSSSPKFTPPLSEQAKILSLNLPCSPCFKRKCPFGHYKCLVDLTPEMVVNAINSIN